MMRLKDEELKQQRQAEIEEMLNNKKVFLQDIQKLNYK